MGWVRRKDDTRVLVGPCMCIRETDRALLIRFEQTDSWVPKSQLHPEENEVEGTGHQGFLVVKEWIAKEKGWA